MATTTVVAITVGLAVTASGWALTWALCVAASRGDHNAPTPPTDPGER